MTTNLTIFALAVLRLIWRFMNPTPEIDTDLDLDLIGLTCLAPGPDMRLAQ